MQNISNDLLELVHGGSGDSSKDSNPPPTPPPTVTVFGGGNTDGAAAVVVVNMPVTPKVDVTGFVNINTVTGVNGGGGSVTVHWG